MRSCTWVSKQQRIVISPHTSLPLLRFLFSQSSSFPTLTTVRKILLVGINSGPFLSFFAFLYTYISSKLYQFLYHRLTLASRHNMFTSLRSLGLGLLFCNPALALLRDWPNNASPFFSIRETNASATTTECGHKAAPGNETCPLNVCCTECGNCGTTMDFCSKGCQNNCDQPQLSTCAMNSSSLVRTVGYYESWANTRRCQNVSPKELNVTGFTHSVGQLR